MGFCLQLKLLLWKNFTLKKRKPLVLMFELIIPLVLFFILIGIRKKQPAYAVGSSRFVAYPLPSAGVIAVMQAFCDNGIRDENGFANFPNSTVTNFLEKLNNLSQHNIVEPGFTPSELDEIPHIYRTLVEDPVAVHDIFVSTANTPIRDLFVDEQELESSLSSNLSLPILGIKNLMNSSLDMSKIYYMIFGSDPRSLPVHAKAIDSVLADALPSITPQSFSSSLRQLLSRLQFVYEHSKDAHFLWEALSWILNTDKSHQFPSVSPFQLAKDFQKLMLSNDGFSILLCQKIRLVSFLKNVSNEKEVDKLQDAICQVDLSTKSKIAIEFQNHLNTTRLMNMLHLEEWNFDSAKERVQKFSDDLKKFYIFEKTLRELSELASSLPQDSCHLTNTSQSDNDTLIDSEKPHVKTRKRNPRYGLLRIWLGMQKTICGKETKSPLPSFPEDGSDINLDELGMSTYQQEQIGILVHVLYSNPKVLYAPNETDADALITKANETFKLLDTVTQYSQKMLNVSEEIQLFLAQNDTEHSLSVLRNIQSNLRSHPEVLNLSKSLQQFADGSIISNKETFLEQLKLIDNAACSWNSLTSGISLNVFQGFRTEEDLLVYFKQRAYFDNVTVLASVIFNMEKNGTLPNHMIYKIRQNASFTTTTNLVRNRFWFPGPRDWGYSYYQFGFVWIQDILERAMTSLYAGRDVSEPGTYVHQFPYPCYMEDQFLFMIEHVMPLCLTISWVYSVSMLVQSIVHEKEQRLKEVMKTMGLNNVVHWLAWFITSFVQMTITAAILTVILKYGLVLTYSDPIVIFLMLEIFVVANIAFSFLVSVLYSKAKLAAACAGIIYFLTYVPYMYIAVREEAAHDTIPAWLKSLASILSTTAFGLGAKYFAFYEEVGVGVQLTNMAVSPLEGDDFSLWQVAVMMLIDTLLYSILVWYIENVHPGAYGLPKPWYFPFTRSYWFGVSRRDCSTLGMLWQRLTRKHVLSVIEHDQACAMANRTEDNRFFEPDPIHLPLGVSIDNLEKLYKNGNKLAVNKLSLNLYENQITSFLGHNGAGKTTTMSILTGLFPPTSGYAIIYGRDIRTEMDLIRQSMGMCPQHNVLFDELTVEEHLWFYARLKGTPESEISYEMEKMIEDLNLPHKRHSKVHCLSGGMKRKLSVAIAFVAGSRIVILDEPTAGVDPYSRRAIWDLILKYKRGRTILLSTHHMDEADFLGDRIAIVAHGQLRCCGSSLFLKNNLGEGYHLIMVKLPVSQTDTDKFDTEKVTNFICHHVVTAYLVSESKHELHYILPLGELRKGSFEKLFGELESSLPLLGISSYGIKHTTLEEVFLQVAESHHISQDSPLKSTCKNGPVSPKKNTEEPEKQSLLDESDVQLEDIANCNWRQENSCSDNSLNNRTGNSDSGEGAGSYRVEGNMLLFQQFMAILTKRCYCTRRNWKGLFSQILLPAFFVSIAMSVALTAPKIEDLPPIVLSPSQYFNYTLPNGNVIAFGHQDGDSSSWSEDANTEKLIDTFHLPSGVGATCVLKSPFKPFNNNVSMRVQEIRDKLLAEYFEPMCQSVFNPGIPLVNFVPVAPTITPKETNGSWYYTTELPSSEERLYPLCHCSSDNTGYVCQSYGYKDPPSFRVVTRDLMMNINQQNEHEYYLYTTDMYRLRRYGAFSFGYERDYVPENFGENSPILFRKIAVRNAAKVWYNNKGYHSMPIYINSINNAILRANLPREKGHPSGYGITLINHPMTDTSYMLSRDQILQGTDVLIAIFIIVAMSFVPASFVLFLVYERYTKAKHLQVVSGVNPIIYWVANYFWDMCSYVVPATCCVLILLIFDIPAYASHKNFPAVVSLFLMYGWSVTPVMYPVSFLFKEPSTAYIFLIVINLFVGITCVVTSFLLEVFSENVYLGEVHKVLQCVFLVFPNYCLGRGLMDIAFNEYQNFFLFKTGQYNKMISPFAWMLVSRKLVAMAISGSVAFVITLLLEYRFFLRQKKKQMNLPEGEIRNEDEDVSAERWRVVSGRADGDILRLVDLTKIYRTNKLGQLLAVNRLCLGIPEGECLGLLGVNGAGKSTTFKMLTGDTTITAGDAFLGGYSVRRELQKVQQFIGYCPQFDALYDELTAREHLCLYSRFRGIPRKEEKKVIEWALKKLDLVLYADRPAGTYSGGNKRKLSTAIALLGAPRIIYLDEPSTGMDPFTRRFMWNLIHDLVKGGRSVVLTSHSMEECEVLCTRMGIMVNGNFKCLGSVQHLKNRFGEGYYITVRTKEHEMETVQRWFRRIFRDATLKESHYNILQYELKSGSISLAYVFSKMESALQELPIDEYSVCQNTLDNVFVNFVKQQSDDSERLNGSFVLKEETLDENSDDDLEVQITRSQSRLAFLHLDVEC